MWSVWIIWTLLAHYKQKHNVIDVEEAFKGNNKRLSPRPTDNISKEEEGYEGHKVGVDFNNS